jgi:hypothetical protein
MAAYTFCCLIFGFFLLIIISFASLFENPILKQRICHSVELPGLFIVSGKYVGASVSHQYVRRKNVYTTCICIED